MKPHACMPKWKQGSTRATSSCGWRVSWLGTPKGDKLEADMATLGVKVHYFPYTAHTSSSALRAIIADR